MTTIIDVFALALIALFFGVPYWVINHGGSNG